MKERVFVTGVDGFVGAHLAKKLMEKYDVIGLMYDSKPVTTLSLLGLQDKTTLVRGDVCNKELMKRVLSQFYVKKVFHLAAQAIVGVALKDPYTTFKVNCLGTASLLEACKEVGSVEGVLVTSTDKIYGEGLNKKETDLLNASGIYETSKICMDYITRSFYHTYKIPVVIPRACNIYGEHDLNKRIVPNTIRALKNKEAPIIFRGERSLREYIYVEDVADAYNLLMENIGKSKGEAFNIGTSNVIGQEELVKKIIEISGVDIKPKYIEKPKNLFEIHQQTINSEKMRKMFNWSPKHTLEEGLKKTWDNWVKSTY